ncbi:putative bifunctional diguanylate cyclase/phosphodiesterase [Phenylobacterium ferrooxidans]|uniref:Bifunctional diguanylate cyclase/phosphodiesterase n=1 Tax=Phenylobacterium ferrooxidans TaxID=2982689 RepID=A0ABW6CQN1_9CAUL
MTVKSGFEAPARRWSISNAVAIPASVALLTVGLSGGVSGTLHPAAATALLAGGAILLARVVSQVVLAERLAARLFEGGSTRSLPHLLRELGHRFDALKHRAANIHPTTGMPTRELLAEEIHADIAHDCGPRLLGAIRFADFDRLAAFDLAAANSALKRFALRLTAATSAAHVIAQIDRDCFAVWFRGPPDLEASSREFRAIVYVAGQELADGATLLTPTVEAGAVSFPRDGNDAGQLLLRVTAGLARPETSRTGDLTLPEPPSAEIAREAFTLEQGLTRAIADDQLTMVFQPVVDLAAARIIGAEALLRWDHPTLGPISPARFIPIVERMGLSDSYGLWVLNAACREARLWQDEGLADLKVAVNLSARQLLDPGLVGKVERTLKRHGLSPRALELELTETATMADATGTLRLFGDLRAMGVSLAIDDFGSGYSSLSYLKNLPFDKLKIDREFVTQIESRRDSRAICKALIELGRGLDLLILAEGVETAEEVQTLHDLGCNVFQGYHFSKPLTGEAFRRLVRDPPAWRVAAPRPRLKAAESRRSA